jgi:hypothetical protein
MIKHPDDGDQPDGLNWIALAESGKNSYICGFVEGMFQGHCFTTWGHPESQSDNPAYLRAIRSFNYYWDRFIANATYRQLLEALDRFYAEERNSKIEVQHGLWIVMNEIAGMPKPKIEEMTSAWREKDGDKSEG